MLVQSGFKILNKIEQYVEPMGYTGLFLLAESNLAIHSFPEDPSPYNTYRLPDFHPSSERGETAVTDTALQAQVEFVSYDYCLWLLQL